MDSIKAFLATHPVTRSIVHLTCGLALSALVFFVLVEFSAAWIFCNEKGYQTADMVEKVYYGAWQSGIAIFILIGITSWAAVGIDVCANHFAERSKKHNTEIEEKDADNG